MDDTVDTTTSDSYPESVESITTDSPHSSVESFTPIPESSKTGARRERPIFVPLLNEYIPLGCISWQVSSPTSHVEGKPNLAWIEAEDLLVTVLGPQYLWNAIVSLWRKSWVRVFRPWPPNDEWEAWRIYVLPEDVFRSVIDRNRPNLRKCLDLMLSHIDISPSTWSGVPAKQLAVPFDKWATGEKYSLFYFFNTLPSPAPTPHLVEDRWSRASMKALLSCNSKLSGLNTQLYPYQRRAAAEMLRREAAPQLQLDPRLEERQSLIKGQNYYYGSRDGTFLRQPRYYDAVRGGILAETMGLGKTLICIALILSTKGHCPRPPPQYAEGSLPVRLGVGSLAQMTASTITRYSLPWRRYFNQIKEEGYIMDECIKIMEENRPEYEISPVFVRSHRSSTYSSPSEVVQLCSTTIIVVPKNLMHQWRAELSKHVVEETLKLLVMEDRNVSLPQPQELAMYDVVLFSRPRFENENKNADKFYESPLTKLHWFRIIIDEGHNFSSSNTHAAVVAEKLVRAERRWVVSGTPAKDLMGVEMDMAAMTNMSDYENIKSARKTSLEQRQFYNGFLEESSGAVRSLGSLASRFLKAQPWAASSQHHLEMAARWDDHIFRHENSSTRTYSSFSSCLRRTLENLVVKTQPEDVERDIELPPLTHEVIRLEPSFVDKLTANLFVLLFTTNAVTSERRDQDYLFHKNSQHHLHRLIANLRQSAFFWTGMQEDAVRSSLEVTWKYLDKKGTTCTPEDRQLLEDTANAANIALTSSLWRAITQTSDMGVSMERWPLEAGSPWAFPDCEDPMAMSLNLAVKAKDHVNDRLTEDAPAEGLAEAGVEAKEQLLNIMNDRSSDKNEQTMDTLNPGQPTLNGDEESHESTRLPAHGASSMTSPQEKSSPKTTKLKNRVVSPQKTVKRKLNFADNSVELKCDSELGSTVLTGSTSSKFTYLIDRVMALQATEKILIFYDGNHIAYFLGEAFDLLNVKYLLYANTLSGEQRGKYVVLFDTDPSHRVMIMDIKQAAHGLNLSSASRVFFVNPPCRPNIEAQAIKRAHRIGQTRPVHVETLILKGCIEEQMYERAMKMTNHEHLQAKTLEDDMAMARIIQEARILPLTPEQMAREGQMAKLQVPQQIFGRPGRGKELVTKLEAELFGDETEAPAPKRPRRSGTTKSGESRKGKAARTVADGDAQVAMLDETGPMEDEPNVSMPALPSTALTGYSSIFGN